MPVAWNREQDSWVVTAGAEPPKDWLDTTIRSALRLSVGNIEPSPTIWDRIRQNIAGMELPPKAEQERLIQNAELWQSGNRRLHQKAANWIGVQMVKWGRKLQGYGTTSPLRCPQVACDH